MTSNAFEKIWEQASTRHPNGLVIIISYLQQHCRHLATVESLRGIN